MIDSSFEEFEEKFEQVLKGEWHIVRKLGQGSFSTVYEVYKESVGFIERAAIKHISFPKDEAELRAICVDIGSEDPAELRGYIYEMVQGFHNEYQIMQGLRGQTNIVSCQDFSIVEKQDMPGYDIFFFMELLKSVAQVSREVQMSQDDVIQMGIDICKALELLQKNNLLHRDIKPENLYVNENGDYKLGDFGSARLISGRQMIVTSKGTQAYIAPEIALMKPAGPYSDIYSLGLVMYRLLNDNRPPFLEDEASRSSMLREKAESERLRGAKIPRPAHGDKELTDIVMRACEYEPKNRYQTASRMRADLEALQQARHLAKEKEKEKNARKLRRNQDSGNGQEDQGVATNTDEKSVPGSFGIASGFGGFSATKPEKTKTKKQKGTIDGLHAFATPEKIKQDQEKTEQERAEEEAKRQLEIEARKLEQEKKRKKKLIISVVVALVLLIGVAAGGVLLKQASDRNKNNEAIFLKAQEQLKTRETIDEGIAKLEELKNSGYKPKEVEQVYQQALKEKKYTAAQDLLDSEAFDEAVAGFSEIGADTKVEEALNAKLIKEAQAEYDQANYDKVTELLKDNETPAGRKLRSEAENGISNNKAFDEALDYMQKAENALKIDPTDYGSAMSFFSEAQRRFKELGTFVRKGDVSASERETECENWNFYYDGKSRLANNQFSQARTIFTDLKEFADAPSMVVLVNQTEKRTEAEALYAKGDLDGAEMKYQELRELGDENGADSGIDVITSMKKYIEAQKMLEQGVADKSDETIAAAEKQFTELGSFNNAAEKVQECGYAQSYLNAERLLEAEQYEEAKEEFSKLKDYSDASERALEAADLKHQEEVYKEAKFQMDLEFYKSAADKFGSIKDYKDAGELAKICEQYQYFSDANTAIANGNLKEARLFLEKLAEEKFDGAQERLSDIDRYDEAITKQEAGSYAEALEIYSSLTGFHDLSSRMAACQAELNYNEAVSLMESDPVKAKAIFEENPGLHQAREMIKTCDQIINYRKAAEAKAAGDIQKAYELFSMLEDYADSAAQASACKEMLGKEEAVRYAQSGNYELAISLLVGKDDEESLNLLREYRYQLAIQYENSREYAKALELYEMYPDYQDCETRIRSCRYIMFYNETTNGANVNEFTRRCLQYIFEYNGYNDKMTWGGFISLQPESAADVALSFARSIEKLGIPMSNKEKADALFTIMMGRERDSSAAHFEKSLDYGMSILYDISVLTNSQELRGICDSIGLPPGTVELKDAKDRNYDVTGYVARFYTLMLNRVPSSGELNSWCNLYFSNKTTIENMLVSLVSSQEFKNGNLSNDEFINAVYQVVFERAADESGRQYILGRLARGTSRAEITRGLVRSKEFKERLTRQGLK